MNKNKRISIVFIALVASLGGLLFGYDTAVIAGAEQSIELYLIDSLNLGSFAHGFTISSAIIGCILGAIISGLLSNSIGRRKTLIIAAVLFFLSALGSAYPELLFFDVGEPNLLLLITFNFYRIIGGMGVGLASAIAPVYISEMSPQHIRGQLVVIYTVSVMFGETVVYSVNWLITLGRSMEWINDLGWRFMFASELIPASLFFILLLFIPETPRFLALKNNYKEAFNILERLNNSKKAAEETLQQIKDSLNTSTTKVRLFYYGKKVVIVGIFLAVLQQFIGINAIHYYAPRIFQSLGADQSTSMFQTIFVGALGVIAAIIAVRFIDTKGRKFLLLLGSAICSLLLVAVAVLFFAGIYGIISLILILGFVAVFQMTWGPVMWVILSEMFPNKIRGQAVSIAVTLNWAANLAVSSTFPSINEVLGTGTFIIYGIISAAAFFIIWFYVPETKNKSLEEIENIWLANNKGAVLNKKSTKAE